MSERLIIDNHVFVLNKENGLYYTDDDFEVDFKKWAKLVKGYTVAGPLKNGICSPRIIMTDDSRIDIFFEELKKNKYGFFDGAPCDDDIMSNYIGVKDIAWVGDKSV